jgi:uncharacterized membrane-anchored protein
MSANITRVLALIGVVLVLAVVNYAIFAKERIKRHGELIYLELAPVDPRSLMQGDYMALRFTIAEAIERSANKNIPATGTQRAAVILDARRVAQFATAGQRSDLSLRYRLRDGRVWLGTNAYFFEEGTAERFAGAKFGEFRVDRKSGEAVLVGLK